MDDAGHGTVLVFRQWVLGFTSAQRELLANGHHRAAKRLGRVPFIQQAGVIRRDGQRWLVARTEDRLTFVFGKLKDSFQ